MRSPTAAAARTHDSFTARETRRRLARGLDRDGILEAARSSRALGDEMLAVGLVADLLHEDANASFCSRDPYVPGDVMRRVLAPLGINVDARWGEYWTLVAELIPGACEALDVEAPLRTLARRDLEPVMVDTSALTAATARVLDGEPYDSVRDAVVRQLEQAAAHAREAELDWVVAHLTLRYLPGEDGLGRLWVAAGARATTHCLPGELITGAAVRAAVRLATARYEDEIVAALAVALDETLG